MVLLIHAHPYPSHSRAGRALLSVARDVSGVAVRSLYDLYPQFDIDVPAEQAALSAADVIVWLHPIYWYSVPGLLKHWFDVVLARGWAYGKGGNALRGKQCLWAATTGGDELAYTSEGLHKTPFPAFHTPIEMTARFCGMEWLEPFIVHGAHTVSDPELQKAAHAFSARLEALTRKDPP